MREATGGSHDAPGAGSDDARVDLKLMTWRARSAIAERGTPEAEARLSELDTPDLWAGTVQDGTARGVMLACEEAISLCRPETCDSDPVDVELGAVFGERELRRKRDLLVASAGARLRFSRKGGVLFVDRATETNVPDCLVFEDRRDQGTLDGFVPVEGERARLFHPGFLRPIYFAQNEVRDILVIEGRKDDPRIRIAVTVDNAHEDHRLRVRFRSLPDAVSIRSRGTPSWENVQHRGAKFVAATLVRSCGRLSVGSDTVEVPGAQCLGRITHSFSIGSSG